MKSIKIVLISTMLLSFAACVSRSTNNSGTSTPIDSTNVKGSAPATYGGNNPALDQDSNRSNTNDTGTKANNVHHTGYDSTLDKNSKRK